MTHGVILACLIVRSLVNVLLDRVNLRTSLKLYFPQEKHIQLGQVQQRNLDLETLNDLELKKRLDSLEIELGQTQVHCFTGFFFVFIVLDVHSKKVGFI